MRGQTLGPKTMVLVAAAIEAIVTEGKSENEKSNEVFTNDSPRAGQSWAIQNIFFEFPKAVCKPGPLGNETEVKIELLLNGEVVAKQVFLEKRKAALGEFVPIHVVGSLEPYSPLVLYPGQTLGIKYTVRITSVTSIIRSGSGGRFTMNYTLNI